MFIVISRGGEGGRAYKRQFTVNSSVKLTVPQYSVQSKNSILSSASNRCNFGGNLILSLSLNSETCFPPWTEFKKRCYLVIDVLSYGWKDAYAACRSLNGSQMITIFSEEENHFAANLAKVFTLIYLFCRKKIRSVYKKKKKTALGISIILSTISVYCSSSS